MEAGSDMCKWESFYEQKTFTIIAQFPQRGNCRKSALFMAPQCFKEESKGVFFTTTAADVNRSYRCSVFLRGQTLEPNVMNIMVCLLLLCCLVDSAAQSCTAELCPSLWNLSPPLTGDVSDINPLTLHHC